MPSWAKFFLEIVQANTMILDRLNNSLENPKSLEEPIPTWARALMEEIDQIDMRLQKLESLDESNSWEDNSPQIEIPDEPINDYPHFSNFVPSNDYYPRDMIDYQYTEARVDIPIFKEEYDPKEYLNEDMTSSLPQTTQFTNPTSRINSTIRCYKCWKVGHVKADCSNLIIVMDDSNPPPTYDSKEFKLEDEIQELDKTISIEHDHIIHDIVLKKIASSYKRYKTFIAFPRRYKILKPSELLDTKFHPPIPLKFSFTFQQKNYIPFKLLLKTNTHIWYNILWIFLFIGAYLLHLLIQI